jgi:hypothetical protein
MPLTVADYLASLPEDRKVALSKVRAVIRKNLPKGCEERVLYGMIGYAVPHKIYPPGYHCKPEDPLPMATLGSMKNHMALHLMTAYMNTEMTNWLQSEFAARGKKLDMGKACIRFKKVEDLPLDVIGEAIARVPVDVYISRIEAVLKKKR